MKGLLFFWKNQPAMEMVVRLAEKEKGPMAEHEEAHSLPRLVDAYDNQFVLSRPSDTTIPREDHNLLHVRDINKNSFFCKN